MDPDKIIAIGGVVGTIITGARLWYVTHRKENRKDRELLVEDFAKLSEVLGTQMTDQADRFTDEIEGLEQRYNKRLDECEADCIQKLDELEERMQKRIRELKTG